MEKLPYNNVSFNQLTKSKWIKQNSVTNQAVQILWKKFNIDVEAATMTPILNQQQPNWTTLATGQTYYVNHLENNHKGNWIFNSMKYDWIDFRIYNMKMNKWNLNFLYNYKGTLHQSRMSDPPSWCAWTFVQKKVSNVHSHQHNHWTCNR